ncbi:MAG: twin-arginine translocation signal domain-containing protein, partial [Lachnospiraceae bacterium]|nr:twin-arginine translocation signal domain-containing protein [Lachnospiraceae bacterium]
MSKYLEKVVNSQFSRRDFLKGSAVATAAVAGLSLMGSRSSSIAKAEEEVSTAHDPVVDLEAQGEWKTAACWNNCGGRCLNKALVVDGVVVRQKTDDTHEDTPDYLQQRACP